jgi:predicted transcriptional regulator
MPRKKPSISATELQVLQTLWDHGPLSVRGVRKALGDQGDAWAYNTIQTLLTRLVQKNVVHARKEARAHEFEAVQSREEVLGAELEELAERLCNGSPTPLVESLVRMKKLSRSQIENLRGLLDELDPKAAANPASGRPRRSR